MIHLFLKLITMFVIFSARATSTPATDFMSPVYQAQTASVKMGLLWAKITSNNISFSFYDKTTFNSYFYTESMILSFAPTADIMPGNRTKLIPWGLLLKPHSFQTPTTPTLGYSKAVPTH